MKVLIKKEIRLLLPAWVVAVLLAMVQGLEALGDAHRTYRLALCASARRKWEGGLRAAVRDIPMCLPDVSRKHECWAAAGRWRRTRPHDRRAILPRRWRW